jgi:hypothetical protein
MRYGKARKRELATHNPTEKNAINHSTSVLVDKYLAEIRRNYDKAAVQQVVERLVREIKSGAVDVDVMRQLVKKEPLLFSLGVIASRRVK